MTSRGPPAQTAVLQSVALPQFLDLTEINHFLAGQFPTLQYPDLFAFLKQKPRWFPEEIWLVVQAITAHFPEMPDGDLSAVGALLSLFGTDSPIDNQTWLQKLLTTSSSSNQKILLKMLALSAQPNFFKGIMFDFLKQCHGLGDTAEFVGYLIEDDLFPQLTETEQLAFLNLIPQLTNLNLATKLILIQTSFFALDKLPVWSQFSPESQLFYHETVRGESKPLDIVVDLIAYPTFPLPQRDNFEFFFNNTGDTSFGDRLLCQAFGRFFEQGGDFKTLGWSTRTLASFLGRSDFLQLIKEANPVGFARLQTNLFELPNLCWEVQQIIFKEALEELPVGSFILAAPNRAQILTFCQKKLAVKQQLTPMRRIIFLLIENELSPLKEPEETLLKKLQPLTASLQENFFSQQQFFLDFIPLFPPLRNFYYHKWQADLDEVDFTTLLALFAKTKDPVWCDLAQQTTQRGWHNSDFMQKIRFTPEAVDSLLEKITAEEKADYALGYTLLESMLQGFMDFEDNDFGRYFYQKGKLFPEEIQNQTFVEIFLEHKAVLNTPRISTAFYNFLTLAAAPADFSDLLKKEVNPLFEKTAGFYRMLARLKQRKMMKYNRIRQKEK